VNTNDVCERTNEILLSPWTSLEGFHSSSAAINPWPQFSSFEV
jgi:hypothetical protein